MKTGERFGDSELSTVDTAILLAGVLFCESYFDGTNPEEEEVRALAEQIYRRVDWRWAQPHAPAISHGWTPEVGFLEYDWRGYNEAMLVYLFALGSPTFGVGPQAWTEWTSTYDKNWGGVLGKEYLNFGPLFGHQYTHVWMDFRKIQDDYMRRRSPIRCTAPVTARRSGASPQATVQPMCRWLTPPPTASTGRTRRVAPTGTTTVHWHRRLPLHRYRSRPNSPFPPSSTCRSVLDNTSTRNMVSSMHSILASISTFRCSTDATSPASAGSTA